MLLGSSVARSLPSYPATQVTQLRAQSKTLALSAHEETAFSDHFVTGHNTRNDLDALTRRLADENLSLHKLPWCAWLRDVDERSVG